MDNKKILSSTAEIFTLSLLFVSLFNLALRGEAEQLSQVSELFALCGSGISLRALAELLVMAVMIAAERYIWFSEKLFPHLLTLWRITWMLVTVFLTVGICCVAFGWFPAGMWQAWLGFTVSFLVSTAVSFAIMMLRSRQKSRQYQQRLHQYRQNREEEEIDHGYGDIG